MSFKRRLQRDGYQAVVEWDSQERTFKSHREQPNRNAIMQRNQELRKARGAVKTTSFGKLALDIPLADMQVLDKFYPGIANTGHPDHKWQLRRFLASPASDPYRVEDFRRQAKNLGHIMVK